MHPRDTKCSNFQAKWTNLTFLIQIWPKIRVSFEIKKANVDIRVSILEIPCKSTFRQNEQLQLFWSKFAQKGI